MSTTPTKNIYLKNKDILEQIHLSKNTYCTFANAEIDHRYDIILDSVERINMRTVAEARRNRADRIKKTTGEVLDPTKIPNTEVVFRIMTNEHVPLVPKKKKTKAPKKQRAEDVLDLSELDLDDDLDIEEAIPSDVEYVHTKVNFPPFFHYRITEDRVPYIVAKSHWQGDLESGEFCKDHGHMTDTLARMFMKLCERYATRSNWRGYTYNDEMRGQALVQLSQIGLQFDESKSQNPFAYYTAAITNSFTRVLNLEKKSQNIRDDILEMNGLNPSYTRQWKGDRSMTEDRTIVIEKNED